MGATFSSEATTGEEELLLRRKQRLRLPFELAQKLVVTYLQYSYQPTVDENGLKSLFSTALRSHAASDSSLSGFVGNVLEAVWVLFSDRSTCQCQEVLTVIILLCDAPWGKRLSLVFDVYKCLGLEELYHEDIQLIAQVASCSLLRLWRSPAWSLEDLRSLTEAIADHAFLKLDKDLTEPVAREQFISWGIDRFRESRTVATSEALLKIYSSTYT